MTALETLLTLTLLIVVPWCAWSAIDLVALRRDVRAWDFDLETEADHRRSLGRRHVELMARVGVLEDARDTSSDIDVPDVDDHPDAPDTPTTPTYRPVPADFWRNR
ncbi:MULTISPECIES: hypothetical protein [unclassified Corynebacterium]|uniref:hypothetical protein n=2 Tax=Corynebacterium TaxID=1716 RepID=UPI0026522F88|nr:hypothetical protein [Corynebacterium sp.]